MEPPLVRLANAPAQSGKVWRMAQERATIPFDFCHHPGCLSVRQTALDARSARDSC
ncbi:hypothetical protein ACFQDN_09245 [Pseudomonas asuensis]|uniref:hypothetical protein n=1 Tax=Pseudomonas asuensis TaxID=1825787 RepID=UPI001662DC61|nr:hypothetical protein [Pseudomonas asuensis]